MRKQSAEAERVDAAMTPIIKKDILHVFTSQNQFHGGVPQPRTMYDAGPTLTMKRIMVGFIAMTIRQFLHPPVNANARKHGSCPKKEALAAPCGKMVALPHPATVAQNHSASSANLAAREKRARRGGCFVILQSTRHPNRPRHPNHVGAHIAGWQATMSIAEESGNLVAQKSPAVAVRNLGA